MLCFSSYTTSTNHFTRKSFWWVSNHAHHLWFVHLLNWHFRLHLSPFNVRIMCAVDDFQRFIFGNSQSSNKFSGNTKIVSHPTSSQESLKQKVDFYIYIAHHLRGQWHIPISPQTAKTPFLGSYYFPVICPTHIIPSCLTKNHPPNTLQRHLSKVLSHNWLMLAGLTFYFIMQFSRLTYSWNKRKLWLLSAAQVWIQYLSHWRLSPTFTLTLLVTKTPSWIFCILTFLKSMIMLQQHLG